MMIAIMWMIVLVGDAYLLSRTEVISPERAAILATVTSICYPIAVVGYLPYPIAVVGYLPYPIAVVGYLPYRILVAYE